MNIIRVDNRLRSSGFWRYIRYLFAFFLLTAIGFKIESLISSSVSLFDPMWVIYISVEIGMASWLILGYSPFLLWMAVLVMWSVFVLANVQSIIIESKSCGCFGRAHVSPVVTLVVDVVLINLVLICIIDTARLMRWVRSCAGNLAARPSISGVSLTVLLLAALVIIIQPSQINNAREKSDGDALVLEALDVPKASSEGNWYCFILDASCPACKDVLDDLRLLRTDGVKIALFFIGNDFETVPLCDLPMTAVIRKCPKELATSLVVPAVYVVRDGRVILRRQSKSLLAELFSSEGV